MLAATTVACPNCSKQLKLSQPPTVGKRLRCPLCGCPFTLTERDLGQFANKLPPPLGQQTIDHLPAPATFRGPPPMPVLSPETSVPRSRSKLLLGIVAALVVLLGSAVGLAIYFAKHDAKDADKQVRGNSGRDAAERSEQTAPSGDRDPSRAAPNDEREQPKPEPFTLVTSLSEEDQGKVKQAIQQGVEFLKKNQRGDGSWSGSHALGMAALPALTLLECGVPAHDPSIQKSATFVRTAAPRNTATYEIALSILFLDRLDDPQDAALIRSLGLRLVAGQKKSGGWDYTCEMIDSKNEPNLLLVLEQTRPRNPLELFVIGNDGKANLSFIGLDQKSKLATEIAGQASKLDADGPFRGVVEGASKLRTDVPLTAQEKEQIESTHKAFMDLPPRLQKMPSLLPASLLKEMPKSDQTDNSNTQFAILGVLASTRHGVPTDRALGLIVQRFRTSQNADGTFGYHYSRSGKEQATPAMTGAGLLGLAVTHGLTENLKLAGSAAHSIQDRDIQKSMTALSQFVERPLGKGRGKSEINLYFLWTVERVGMLYGLSRINDKDWYHWGAELLLSAQGKNGSWSAGGYYGSTPVIDTSFALLFLNRANLAKDLAAKIRSKLELIDEGK